MIPYILSGDVLTVLWDDGTPKQVAKNHKYFEQILEEVSGTPDNIEAAYKRLELLITPIKVFKNIAFSGDISLTYNEDDGIVCKAFDQVYDIDDTLASSILDLYVNKGDIVPFANFIEKMYHNPDQDIAKQLWKFIKVAGLCLTPEGNFLAYKNVNNDFTSVYDGDTDNTPGTVLGMPRSSVQKNADITCSSGLHFAAWGYLQHYAPGRKTVLVSVSPKDVVSIPSDYSHKKGRACRYRIVREVAQPEELKNIFLFDEEGTDYEDYED